MTCPHNTAGVHLRWVGGRAGGWAGLASASSGGTGGDNGGTGGVGGTDTSNSAIVGCLGAVFSLQSDTGAMTSAGVGSLPSVFSLKPKTGVTAGSNIPCGVTFVVDLGCSNAHIVPNRAYLHDVRPCKVYHFRPPVQVTPYVLNKSVRSTGTWATMIGQCSLT